MSSWLMSTSQSSMPCASGSRELLLACTHASVLNAQCECCIYEESVGSCLTRGSVRLPSVRRWVLHAAAVQRLCKHSHDDDDAHISHCCMMMVAILRL